MSNSKCLLIASSEPYTGKSATILGIAHQLQKKGIKLGYGKPIGTYFQPNDSIEDEQDLQFISQTLNLPPERVQAPLLLLNEKTIIDSFGQDINYQDHLLDYVNKIQGDLILLEGGGTLTQGNLFHLSIPEITEKLDASVLLVVKYKSLLVIGEILNAKKLLGDHLVGVLINNVPTDALDTIENTLKPFLTSKGVEVLGILPTDRLLQSVSVRELASQLKAEVLCREDRLDLMVESLTVGAMNVNSALEYFRKGTILTGHTPPQQLILARAKDLEIPILSVNVDTLTTVEIVDRAFGTVRLHETIKVECVRNLIEEHFNIDRLWEKINS